MLESRGDFVDKENLLSIGDMAKLSKSSVFSLRYYERLNILSPAYIDPETSYRYYTFDQVYLVNLIMLCVELGIPLKEFKKFLDKSNVVNAEEFLIRGKETAIQKTASLEKGLKFIDDIEKQIDLAKQNEVGAIYKRNIPERAVYAKPYIGDIKNLKAADLAREFFDIPFAKDEYDEYLEYGFLCEYLGSEIKYYAFIQLPKYIEGKNVKILPSGTYLCVLGEQSRIEQAPSIFKEHLSSNSFIAIETDLISSKYDVNAPLIELKVMLL